MVLTVVLNSIFESVEGSGVVCGGDGAFLKLT